MTFQPPPPPPGGSPPPPPPPPGGQWGPPPGGSAYGPTGGASAPGQGGAGGYGPGGPGGYGPPGRSGAGFDPKSVNPLDWAILACGLLAFIFSFINFYTYSGKGSFSNNSVDDTAWTGFFGWFAVLLAVIGAALVAVSIFAPQVKLPVPARLAAAGAFALAVIFLILALLVVPDYNGGGPGYDSAVDEGHGFGYWATLVVIIAGLVLSVMRLQQTGGKLPGALANMPNIGGGSSHGSQGGYGAGAPQQLPPPQAGYGQQPPQAGGYGQPAPPAPQPGYQSPPPAPQPGYQQPPPQQGGYGQQPPPGGYGQQ